MSGMFEVNKPSRKEEKVIKKSIEPEEPNLEEEVAGVVLKVKETSEEEKDTVLEKKEAEKEEIKEEYTEEEYYTIYKAAKMLGISHTFLRDELTKYGIEAKRFSKTLMVSKENVYKVKRYRIVDGLRKLSCIEDFELCESCMERALNQKEII